MRVIALLLATLALGGCMLATPAGRLLAEPASAPIVRIQADRPIVALALGSGGARGFAHVGVIKALEAAGFKPDIVVGASSGAVVGALYAAGLDAAALESVAAGLESSDLIDVSVFDGFKVRGERLEQFITASVGYRPMEDLPRKFAVVATDAETGALTVFNRGNPGRAVRASASVPRLFVPPIIGGRTYIDGGIVAPVPVKLARAMGADVVVAVDISRIGTRTGVNAAGGAPAPTAGSRPSRRALLDAELAEASVVIRPRLERSGLLDFEQKHAALAAGEDAVRAALPTLNEALAAARAARSAALRR